MLSGGLGGNLSVICGSQHAAETTMKISTTTASSTIRLLRPSSVVSSMEHTVTFSINKNNSDVITSTAAFLSEELKCDHRIGSFYILIHDFNKFQI